MSGRHVSLILAVVTGAVAMLVAFSWTTCSAGIPLSAPLDGPGWAHA